MAGRRPINPNAPKSATISTRFTPELRGRLEEVAKKNGCSLSEEIGRRLELSFTENRRSEDKFGGVKTYNVLLLIARAFRLLREMTGQAWFDDPLTFEEAEKILNLLLSHFRPDGERKSSLAKIRKYQRVERRPVGDVNGYPYADTCAGAVLAELNFAFAGMIAEPDPESPRPGITQDVLRMSADLWPSSIARWKWSRPKSREPRPAPASREQRGEANPLDLRISKPTTEGKQK
jgi:hypothetical protein